MYRRPPFIPTLNQEELFMFKGLFSRTVAKVTQLAALLGMSGQPVRLHGKTEIQTERIVKLNWQYGSQKANQIMRRRRKKQLGNYSRWRNRPAHRRISPPSLAPQY
jgi:hypothetical protein